jgi:hypothetical protein
MVRLDRRSLSLFAACLGLVAVAGCAAKPAATAVVGDEGVRAASPTAPSTASPPPGSVNVGAFGQLARQEAVAWARSPLAKAWRTGLVVLSPDDLSAGPSAGFPSGQDKADFLDGDLVFTGRAPSVAPAGVVTWPDGSTLTVPVLSLAKVPAWAFTLLAYPARSSRRRSRRAATSSRAAPAARRRRGWRQSARRSPAPGARASRLTAGR